MRTLFTCVSLAISPVALGQVLVDFEDAPPAVGACFSHPTPDENVYRSHGFVFARILHESLHSDPDQDGLTLFSGGRVPAPPPIPGFLTCPAAYGIGRSFANHGDPGGEKTIIFKEDGGTFDWTSVDLRGTVGGEDVVFSVQGFRIGQPGTSEQFDFDTAGGAFLDQFGSVQLPPSLTGLDMVLIIGNGAPQVYDNFVFANVTGARPLQSTYTFDFEHPDQNYPGGGHDATYRSGPFILRNWARFDTFFELIREGDADYVGSTTMHARGGPSSGDAAFGIARADRQPFGFESMKIAFHRPSYSPGQLPTFGPWFDEIFMRFHYADGTSQFVTLVHFDSEISSPAPALVTYTRTDLEEYASMDNLLLIEVTSLNGRYVLGQPPPTVRPLGRYQFDDIVLSIDVCPADFNGSGDVTVQDIFDLLVAYFAADPRADVNGVGGVTIQDVFDFLTAYFTGCP